MNIRRNFALLGFLLMLAAATWWIVFSLTYEVYPKGFQFAATILSIVMFFGGLVILSATKDLAQWWVETFYDHERQT